MTPAPDPDPPPVCFVLVRDRSRPDSRPKQCGRPAVQLVEGWPFCEVHLP